MRSAHALRRSGWTLEMFRVGSTVTVTGSPERTKARQCYLSTILFADGTRMRCKFMLRNPDRGLAGGGEGDCQMSTHEKVFDAVLG